MQHSNGTVPAAPRNELVEESKPYSEEAEQAVLGSILIDPDAFYEVDLIIKAKDFFRATHKQIYQAMSDLYAQNLPVDLITVTELLKKRHGDAQEAYIIGLINVVPTAINASSYARVVESDSMRRALIDAGHKILNDAMNGKKSISALVESSELALFNVTSKSSKHNVKHIKTALSEFYDRVMERQNTPEKPGIRTGLIELDKILGGLKPSRQYVIAARPGMGKSVLEKDIAAHAAENQGKRGAKFNLEMDNDTILQRKVSAYANIPYQKIEDGTMNQSELARFSEAIGKLSQLNLWLDDSAGLSLSQLRAKALRLHMENGLDFFSVDYLTLMQVNSKYNNRTNDVGTLSRGLKELAKELKIPSIVLAQLSRRCEERHDKRPLLSDLRDSGEIEQDADVVIFIYRDEYYNPETTMNPGEAELIVAKNRHGKTGTAKVRFDGQHMRFEN